MLTERLILDGNTRSPLSPTNYGGHKTIGFWGGFNLLANNICGPAIVLLPALFQQAGIIPTTIVLMAITILSGVCCWMMVEVMKSISGNQRFHQRHEYMSVVKHFLSPTHYWMVFVFYQMSMMSILISNIIQSAQVFDIAIADAFGCSYGIDSVYASYTVNLYIEFRFSRYESSSEFESESLLQSTFVFVHLLFICPLSLVLSLGFSYYPHFGYILCGDDLTNNVEPWNTDWVISIGFLIVGMISVPFALLNLEDNIILQWIATLGFIVIAILWIVIFTEQPTWSGENVPWATTDSSHLVGVVLFNYGFIVTVPSWINEKKHNVSSTQTVVFTLGFMFTVFYFIGLFGAFAYSPYYMSDEDIFDKLINSKGNLALMGKVTVYLEPIIQNITSIPIFSIIIRYNLLDVGFSKCTATFWSIIFPWTLALPLYNGNGFNNLCNWTGIVFIAYVNFIVPPYLFIWALIEKQNGMYQISTCTTPLRSKSVSFDVTLTDPVMNDGFDAIRANNILNGLASQSVNQPSRHTSSCQTPSRRRSTHSTKIELPEDAEIEIDMTATGTRSSGRYRIGTFSSIPSLNPSSISKVVSVSPAPRLVSYDVDLEFLQEEKRKDRKMLIMACAVYIGMWIISLIGIVCTIYGEFRSPDKNTV